MTTREEIAKSIIACFTDRRGFRQAWDSCDEDVQQEIREAVVNELSMYKGLSLEDNERWEIEYSKENYRTFVGGNELTLQLCPGTTSVRFRFDEVGYKKATKLRDALEQSIKNYETGNRSWNGFG